MRKTRDMQKNTKLLLKKNEEKINKSDVVGGGVKEGGHAKAAFCYFLIFTKEKRRKNDRYRRESKSSVKMVGQVKSSH